MATKVFMEALSPTMEEGRLVKWNKNEGDAVKSGDMLAEVETDKATMELESFFDGTLLKIFAPGGKHLMLWGVNDTAISRGKMTLTFLLANGDSLLVDAIIQKPGAAAPAPAPQGKEHDAH